MYHQMSKVSGRLVAAKNLQTPLFPVAPVALQRVEPPTIQYTTNHFSTVQECTTASGKRNLVPGTNVPYAPLNEKIRKTQILFQKDNDVPVFLKGGPMDNVLYRFTMGLCLVGLAGVVHFIYESAYPKK